jgi:hypothetical protein
MRFHIHSRGILPTTYSAILGITAAFGYSSVCSVAISHAAENPTSNASAIISETPQKDKNGNGADRDHKDDHDRKRNGKHKSKGKHKKQDAKKTAEMKGPEFKGHPGHRRPEPGPRPQQLRGNVLFLPDMPNVPFNAMPLPIQSRAFKVSDATAQHDEILTTLRNIERSMKNIESMMRHERSGHETQPRNDQPPFSGVPLHGPGVQHGPGAPHGPGPQNLFGVQNLIPQQLQQGNRPHDMGPRHEPQSGRPQLLHDPRGPQTHPETRGDDRGRPDSQDRPVPYSPN